MAFFSVRWTYVSNHDDPVIVRVPDDLPYDEQVTAAIAAHPSWWPREKLEWTVAPLAEPRISIVKPGGEVVTITLYWYLDRNGNKCSADPARGIEGYQPFPEATT